LSRPKSQHCAGSSDLRWRYDKAVASRNAWTGGMRPLLRELAEELREQDKIRREILD
jgi:hypothetical protein